MKKRVKQTRKLVIYKLNFHIPDKMRWAYMLVKQRNLNEDNKEKQIAKENKMISNFSWMFLQKITENLEDNYQILMETWLPGLHQL